MSLSKAEQLFQAAIFGNLEATKLLCSDPDLNVNWENEGRYTPFHVACEKGHVELVEYLLTLKQIAHNKPSHTGGTPFYMSCQNGHKKVVSVLLADPRIDPNCPRNGGTTPFFIACQKGQVEVVSLLLADPRIDPNEAKNTRTTPFYIACESGHKEVVSLLLADPRIDPNRPRNDEATPLYHAAQDGFLEIVQSILASGREMDTKRRVVSPDPLENGETATEWVRVLGSIQKPGYMSDEIHERAKVIGPIIADHIDEYERDPVAARYRLRRLPALRNDFVVHLFALVVFHSDSFVVINERMADSDTRRFLMITSRLPLDLQMVLCNRIFASPRDIILSRDSEPRFRYLARTAWQ